MLFAVCICFSCVSCNSGNVYNNPDYYWEEGKLIAAPRFAYYNNGDEVKGLKELDAQMAAEGVKNDGSFVIYFAVTNKTGFDKKITSISINSIVDSSGNTVVKPDEVEINDDVYLANGQTINIPCSFSKDRVEREIRLSDGEFNTTTDVIAESCVVNGPEPAKADSGLTGSVAKAVFTEADGIEGIIKIRNNNKTDINLNTISFTLLTDKGVKVTNEPVSMNVDTTLGADEVISLDYAVIPKNVNEKVTENKDFNTINIKLN